MSELPGPYEFWDMASGETRVVKLMGAVEGQVTIEPRYPGAPRRKTVECVRLYLTEDSKPHVPHYWDITSKLLIAALRPYLAQPDVHKLELTIQKFGEAPRARFGLSTRRVSD